jgi:hypothetical protein
MKLKLCETKCLAVALTLLTIYTARTADLSGRVQAAKQTHRRSDCDLVRGGHGRARKVG